MHPYPKVILPVLPANWLVKQDPNFPDGALSAPDSVGSIISLANEDSRMQALLFAAAHRGTDEAVSAHAFIATLDERDVFADIGNYFPLDADQAKAVANSTATGRFIDVGEGYLAALDANGAAVDKVAAWRGPNASGTYPGVTLDYARHAYFNAFVRAVRIGLGVKTGVGANAGT